jgi:lipoprotein-anchoring transpeptidase ErfK/SrfK
VRVRVLAIILAVTVVAAACGSSSRPKLTANSLQTTTSAAGPTTTRPHPCGQALSDGESFVATAVTQGQVPIFARPNAPKPVRTLPNPVLVNNDPHAPTPLVFLVQSFPSALQCQWLRVYLPVRPNGSTGWVRASDINWSVDPYRVEAQLSAFKLKVFKKNKLIDDIVIGVARNNTPTPGGVYYTTELLKPPDPNGPYGPYAYGLSGFSNTLTSFNGGPGQLGIHGTDQPQYLGTQVSHGCIRMSNDNITKLAQFLPIGTPVKIDA